jgi:hypothetical protein
VKKSPSSKHHDIFILPKYLPPLLFLLSFIFFGATLQNALAEETSDDESLSISIIGTPQNALAEETSDDTLCCQCHNDICEDALYKKNAHLPFLQLESLSANIEYCIELG